MLQPVIGWYSSIYALPCSAAFTQLLLCQTHAAACDWLIPFPIYALPSHKCQHTTLSYLDSAVPPWLPFPVPSPTILAMKECWDINRTKLHKHIYEHYRICTHICVYMPPYTNKCVVIVQVHIRHTPVLHNYVHNKLQTLSRMHISCILPIHMCTLKSTHMHMPLYTTTCLDFVSTQNFTTLHK